MNQRSGDLAHIHRPDWGLKSEDWVRATTLSPCFKVILLPTCCDSNAFQSRWSIDMNLHLITSIWLRLSIVSLSNPLTIPCHPKRSFYNHPQLHVHRCLTHPFPNGQKWCQSLILEALSESCSLRISHTALPASLAIAIPAVHPKANLVFLNQHIFWFLKQGTYITKYIHKIK